MQRSGIPESGGRYQQGAKNNTKKGMSDFPIQNGMFTLLDFGHSKVEAAAREDIKLVDIEFKKHDPHKIVENHMDQFNMKRYMHENSLYDEIFRGVRSYEEVQNRFLTLPQTNNLVSSSFRNTCRTVCQRYCREIQ